MAGSQELRAFEVEYGYSTSHAEAVLEWMEYAASRFPEEACGFIMADGTFLPVRNDHPNPTKFFQVDDETHYSVLAAGKVLAFMHSHTDEVAPNGGILEAMDCPSADDMEAQQASGVAWGISRVGAGGTHPPIWFGDELGRLPLIGRSFLHGVLDCMATIRDWHHSVGITTVPNQPRDNNWWKHGKDLYVGNIEAGGFRRVQRVAPIPGDVFLCSIWPTIPVLHHGGIYLGENDILHHLPGRLSKIDSAHLWGSKMDFLVRHKDLPEDFQP